MISLEEESLKTRPISQELYKLQDGQKLSSKKKAGSRTTTSIGKIVL